MAAVVALETMLGQNAVDIICSFLRNSSVAATCMSDVGNMVEVECSFVCTIVNNTAVQRELYEGSLECPFPLPYYE